MAIGGKGMLVICTDIPGEQEAEFNLWYDREHTEERVAIPGFAGARRWVLESGDGPKYLALYETETFDVLSSAPYKAALAAQTDWSKKVMAHFRGVKRTLGRITRTAGLGQGGVVTQVRLRPKARAEDGLREALTAAMETLTAQPGIVSAFLLESDPEMSRPLPEQVAAGGDDGSNHDWLLYVESTTAQAGADAFAAHLADADLAQAGAGVRSRGIYRLLWGLTREELAREGRLRG